MSAAGGEADATLASELARTRSAFEKYAYLFDNNPLPAFVYDLETLRFLAVNHAACLEYGYTPDEFRSIDIRVIRPAEDVPALLENIATHHETYQRSGPWRHKRRDGSILLVEVSSHEMQFEGRSARLVVVHDVTERERARADLDEFARTISHDLQEPLRSIAAFAELLEHKLPDLPVAEAAEYAAYILQGTRRMQEMIDALLVYSRAVHRTAPAQAVRLEEAVDAARRNLEAALAESSGEVSTAVLPTIEADENQMVQLFQNLISNAIKYRGADPPRVRITSQPQESGWLIRVADNGIGIAPEQQRRIFALFHRAPGQAQPGHGVGLAVCKKIVERLGGRISVESSPGRGSTFLISLPVASARRPR